MEPRNFGALRRSDIFSFNGSLLAFFRSSRLAALIRTLADPLAKPARISSLDAPRSLWVQKMCRVRRSIVISSSHSLGFIHESVVSRIRKTGVCFGILRILNMSRKWKIVEICRNVRQLVHVLDVSHCKPNVLTYHPCKNICSPMSLIRTKGEEEHM